MTLTEPGRLLLDRLDQPDIRGHLDRYAQPSPKWNTNRAGSTDHR
jgi:hypothetical protein